MNPIGDLLGSGAMLAGIGWAAYQARNLGMWVASTVRRSLVSTLIVPDDNSAFPALLGWVSRRSKRHRDVQPGIAVGESVRVAPGQSWLWDRGRPVFVNYFRSDAASGGRYAPSERLTLTFLTRDSGRLETIVREAEAEAIKPDTIRVMYQEGHSWQVCSIPSRRWETVTLPGETANDVRADVVRFFESADWYRQRGIPHRRGYLLEGPPGTGKTTLAIALATALKRPLAVFQLSEAKDSSLASLIRCMEPGSILLFEDVDCAGASVSRKCSPVESGPTDGPISDSFGRLTLSGLLNAIDGVAAPVGCVTMFTTNHPDRLDPALLRPGRVDRRVVFGPVTSDQAKCMFQRFFPGRDGRVFAESMVRLGATAAMVQQELMRLSTCEDSQ